MSRSVCVPFSIIRFPSVLILNACLNEKIKREAMAAAAMQAAPQQMTMEQVYQYRYL